MGNDRIQAARDYHDGTKHPGGNLMSRAHTFDPMRRPMPFKIYSSLEPMPLPRDLSPVDVPALTAVARDTAPCEAHRTPDIDSLARILHYSAGITKLLKYPWGDMTFRAAACTGALYHIELYLVCGDLPGLAAGVYHFDPSETALRRLRAGHDRLHRRGLAQRLQVPGPRVPPRLLGFGDHSGQLAGRLLGTWAALQRGGRLLGRDGGPAAGPGYAKRDGGGAPTGRPRTGRPGRPAAGGGSSGAGDDADLRLRAGLSGHTGVSPIIVAFDQGRGRGLAGARASGAPAPEPMGRLTALEPQSEPDAQGSPLESVIVRRGSTRRFSQGPITFAELSTTLNRAMGDVPADFHEPPSRPFNDAYLIANAVDGLDAGAYFFHRERQTLELLEAGELRTEAGHLGLDQSLPADASINIFMMTDLERVLERFGNRGYRAAQLEASVTAGRVYLAAYALGLGATDLTFFDDAVTDFFSPHAQGKSAMFLVAVGKRARRR